MSDAETVAGRFAAIVGPSGSGKDTLIAWLRDRLADGDTFMFVRRVVTRTADRRLEDHDSMQPEEFARARARGEFAVVWEAHGLSYAIPGSVKRHIGAGGIAIANGSRRALPELREVFPGLAVIELAVRPEVLAKRLAGRGREDEAAIAARLAERNIRVEIDCDVLRIDNSGPIELAGQTALRHLRKLAGEVPA